MVAFVLSAVLLAGSQVVADDRGRLETLVELMLERIALLEERVEALETENDRLRERLALLEGSEEAQADDGNESGPDRVMQITRIVAMPIDQEKVRQAEELEKQAAVHEERAAEYEKQRSRIPEGTTAFRGNAKTNHRDRQNLFSLARDERSEATRLAGQATRLRREAIDARQIIYGWDGERPVILETQRDFSGMLDKIGAGGFLTWRGRLIGFDEDGQRYSASWIGEADRPSGFEEME